MKIGTDNSDLRSETGLVLLKLAEKYGKPTKNRIIADNGFE